jgi:hypothetical protein
VPRQRELKSVLSSCHKFMGNAFMFRRSLALGLLSLALAAVLCSAGCSGPDAPVKKGGGSSGKSLTTGAN